MTKLLRSFGSLLGRYFRYWQLTIGLISLLVQVLIFQVLSSMGWGTFLNYWLLLASPWLGKAVLLIWSLLVAIEGFLMVFCSIQWFQNRADINLTIEAICMILLAIIVGFVCAYGILANGKYDRLSSLAYGDRQYHLFVHSPGNGIPDTLFLNCDRTGFYCRQIELPITASIDLLKACDRGKGTTHLIYDPATNNFIVTTPTTVIPLDRSPLLAIP